MDEPTLEFFVRDSFTPGVSDEECRRIVAMLESYRTIIERRMNDFRRMDDYDPRSWRAFREGMWSHAPDEINARIAELILVKPRIAATADAG